MVKLAFASLIAFATVASAHYTFPGFIGGASGDWVNVRRTNNYQSNAPVTDVSSSDFRCYTSGTSATTASVNAGSTIGFRASQAIYHPGVLNVYMAKAPGSVNGWDGSGQVWFKVYQVTANTNGGSSITFPTDNQSQFTFTIPSSTPSGEYLVRVEHIALHSASSFGGAQFYISCAQVKVNNGGSGSPGPLVSIPGVYTGREPGIMLNIYYPIPTSYQQPGPSVWRG
ncbi:fungal cellulose binding domain-containing protein [Panaeolus papilionaceus]|nr:fungal cellulose binding domain-containing protein [Panaeolus papilionaceus]